MVCKQTKNVFKLHTIVICLFALVYAAAFVLTPQLTCLYYNEILRNYFHALTITIVN